MTVTPGNNCAATGYHSIIYNRATDFFYINNTCIGMVTEAGNLRGGVIVCGPGSDTAAECVSSATPTSQGRATAASSTTYFAAVENNTTYYSGCAI